ncbi:glycosyltransferase [Sporosarcina ureilytica]|uniref:Glycosyl transferase n=1 Tax=Sporosarcina ureilytica TaxID=298596 RepID=A0A1D8JJA1_9BACL|nr:glycosyltransferase [Sporosarcina ureilytica]AOV08782.1 glycosyl transferase [Sporosarcina ureilytica]
MKICHLTSVHLHTDTRIFIKECKSLAEAGFEVHFVVPDAPTSMIDGVQVHGVTKGTGNRFNRMTKTVDRVYKKGLEIDADVYHFHDPELIPVGLKLKKHGKKVIYDIHEDLPRALLSKIWINPLIRKPLAWLFEVYENYGARKFDVLMTATPFITERFKNVNTNTININNYPLLNELQSTELESDQEKQKQVCYVGGLGLIRGANQLLDAADLINGSINIAGPINPQKLEEQIIAHNNIEYLGVINRLQVKELLASSVAGIVTFLPEPNHINAQPNKMFEYMSAGIPVICSNFPLWRSIIEKHDCGICVNPENPIEIAYAINYLFENPDIAKRMGQNGRKAVETEYNWEKESQKLIEAYKKLQND